MARWQRLIETAGILASFALGAAALTSAATGCGSDGPGGSTASSSGGGGMASSNGGAGGTGATSSSSSGVGGATECTTSADCPATGNECVALVCEGKMCIPIDVPAGTIVANQVAGDCMKIACDGDGAATMQTDDADAPDDANDCTVDSCSGGVPSHAPSAKDTACSTGGGALCDGAGECVECTAGGQCPSGVCQGGACKAPLPDCQTAIPGGDVTGSWVASVGEQGYLEVQQSGACVTGQSCEHIGANCYPIQGGVLAGDQLFFYYTFGQFQTDATLTLSANGMTLMGELYSDKCNCSVPHTYLKQ